VSTNSENWCNVTYRTRDTFFK